MYSYQLSSIQKIFEYKRVWL